MDHLKITIFDNPEAAPNYTLPEYEPAVLDSAVVVGKGTVEGNPTVDLIFTDVTGQKHVALVKGSYLEALGKMITAKRN